jgi:WD40 repeat protein/serine/threonine protein kinase
VPFRAQRHLRLPQRIGLGGRIGRHLKVDVLALANLSVGSQAKWMGEKERMESDPDGTLPAETPEPEQGEGASAQVLERLQNRIGKESRYQILGEFARGGMGAILKVWDQDLRRTLAMKVVLGKAEPEEKGSTPAVDEKSLGRFLEEAQITGQLDHPGIVPVYELGMDTDGQVYFTMRLVKGIELGEVFELVREGKDGWTHARAVGTILKVCEAMAFAHSKDVIHRDLKPANIMVGKYGEVYVMDWGLARTKDAGDKKDLRLRPAPNESLSAVRTDRREESGSDSPLMTMDGDVVGTPGYMSPEQARGDLEAMGPPSDVYAIGAILYHLLAGHMPYAPPGSKLNAYGVWALVQNGPPMKLDAIANNAPVELIAICEKAMERQIADRYPDMGAMAEDLQAYIEGRVVKAHRTGAVVELKKWVSRNKPLAAALVLAVGGLGGIGYVQTQGRKVAEHERERADTKANEALQNLTLAQENETQAKAANQELLRTQSLFLADLANQKVAEGDAATGLLLALEGSPIAEDDRPYVPQIESALYGALMSLRELAVLGGHEEAVMHAAFNHDGGRIVTASMDGTARLWSAEGEQLTVLRGHEGAVFHAAFNHDGRRVVTASLDDTARLWTAAGEELAVLRHTLSTDMEKGWVVHVEFNHDGSRIVTASMDGTARVWSAAGEELAVLRGHEAMVFHAAFNHDGSRIVTSSDDARVWSADGDQLAVLGGHEGPVKHAAFNRDGSRIVTASKDGTARVWTVDGTELVVLGDLWSGTSHAEFSGDGTRVLTAGDGTARVWSTNGEELAVMEDEDTVLVHDGDDLVTSSSDGIVRLRTPHGEERAILGGHEGGVVHAEFNHDGSRLLTASVDGTARLWRTDEEEFVVLHSTKRRGSPDGNLVVTTSRDGTVDLTASVDGPTRLWSSEGEELAVLRGHEAVFHAAFSHDGSRIVTISMDGTARLWSSDGEELAALGGNEGWGYAAFNHDGTRIVTASGDGLAHLWGSDGEGLAVLSGHESQVVHAAFEHDGTRIITSSKDGTARMWHSEGGELAVLRGHDSDVLYAGFNQDGSRIVTASEDGTARLWSAEGEPRAVLRGHEAAVAHAEFNDDGSRIVTVSEDGTARLWSTDGHELAVLRGRGSSVRHATFNDDGSRIVMDLSDGTTRIYPVYSFASLTDRAIEVAPRRLTPDQRKTFFLDTGTQR